MDFKIGGKVSVFLSCFYCLCAIYIPAFASEKKLPIDIPNRTVRVGFYPQEGYHNYQNGVPVSGYGYDYLQHLRRYAPWQYQYTEQQDNWTKTLQLLFDGKIDLLTNVRKTAGREALVAFSERPMGRSSTILTVKNGDTRYHAGDYAQWNGIRIGVPRSTYLKKIMDRFAKQHGFIYIEIPYDDIPKMLHDLQSGEKLDAALSHNLRRIQHEWILEQLDTTDYYIAVRKDKPELLAQLNAAMAQLELADPTLRNNLWRKYFTQTITSEVQFSEAEANFIRNMQEHGHRFTAILNPDRYPLSYFADGKQHGTIRDIASEIIRRTKLNIDFLPVKTPEEYLEACKNPEVDFVFDQKYQLDEGEQKGLVLSYPYISLSAFLLKNRMAGALPKKYVLVEGYRIIEPLKARLPDDAQIQFCKTSAEAIKLVTDGVCDATCLHSAAAESAVRNDRTDSLEISLLPKLNIDLCVGTRDTRNPLLASIMSKSVASINDNVIREIVRKHTLPNISCFSFEHLMYRHPLPTFGIPLLLLSIFCGFLIWILTQRRHTYRLGVVFKNLPVHYFFADEQGKLLQYNLGNTPDLSNYKTLDDVKDETMRNIFKKGVSDALTSGQSLNFVYTELGRQRSCVVAPISTSIWGRPAVIGVSSDITELSQSRKEAWENAEFLHLTLRSIGEGVITTDIKGNITMINPVAERMIGVACNDVIGKPHANYFKITSTHDGSVLESPILRALRTGGRVEIADHIDLMSFDGKTRWHISNCTSPITNIDGTIIGAILVFRDIAEEYNQSEGTATELAKWEAVAKIADIYHFNFDPVTRTCTGSDQIKEIWPFENGYMVPAEKWIYSEDLPEWKKQYTTIVSGNQREATLSYRALDHDKMRYFRGYMRGSEEPNGKITGMIQEITKFVEAEQKQNAMQELWADCLEHMPLVFFIKSIDDDFRYLQCNGNFARFIGKSVGEIIGRTDKDFFASQEDVAYFREHDMQAVAAENPITLTETMIDRNQNIRHFQTLKFCTKGLNGRRILIGMGLDITDDHNRQEKLNEMLEDWENVANVANIGSFRLDNNMIPLDATRRMAQFWPIGKDGKPLPPEEHLTPEDVTEYKKIYTAILNGERNQASMLCHVPAPDGMRYLRLFIRRNPEKSNIVSGLLQDVTVVIREQKKREALLAMWRNVVNTLPAMFFVKNADDEFRYLQVNRNFCEQLGRSASEIIGRHEFELLPNTEEAARNANEDRLTMESRKRQDFVEYIHIIGDEQRHYQTVKIPSIDEDGHRILICMSQDITDTQALAEVRNIITAAFETLFSSDDLEEPIREIMKTICMFLGFDRAYVGCINEKNNEMRIFSSYHPDTTEAIVDLNSFSIKHVNTLPWYINLKESGSEDVFQFDLSDDQSRKEAKYHIPTLLHYAKKHDIRGVHVKYISVKNQPWGCIGFITCGRPVKNLSDNENMLLKYIAHIFSLAISRKQVLNQLRSALDNALAADKAKTFFLSSMSHEIRTPLNAVIGFTDLLKDPDLDLETREEYLRSVSEASNALLTLLNDILELSKLTSNKSVIHPVMTNIQSFVDEMNALFRSAARQKGLILDISADNVPELFVDQARLRQILFNLIGNAIKYTKVGKVTVSLSFHPTSNNSGTLCIQVADTGVGIADDDREKMFEPFVQMSRMRGTNASGAGTGLGLAIVKQIVQQSNGNLTLESTVGRGSTFTVKIPNIVLHTMATQENTQKRVPDFMNNFKVINERIPRVLIVDDSKVTLDILTHMLDWMHVPHQSASSAKEALELLKTESFDVLVTDILMPEMNGMELAQEIRDNQALSTMRIIAMSTENEATMYDKNLFDKVMLKPIVRNALYDGLFKES